MKIVLSQPNLCGFYDYKDLAGNWSRPFWYALRHCTVQWYGVRQTLGGVVMGRKSDILTYGRQLHDVGRLVAEAVHEAGGNDEDVKRIFDKIVQRQIGMLVMGKLKLALQPCQIHAANLIPDWCKEIVEDVAPTDFKVSDLEFIRFLNEGESPIGGTAMRQKAVVLKANYGLSDAKRLLDHQDEIPTDMRGKYIVFTGTVLRVSDGVLCVAYLYWFVGRWCLDFGRLDGVWGDVGRLPRRK